MYFNIKGGIPHVAIAGATGNGKSAFLKWFLYVLCHQQSEKYLDIHIIDLKGGATFAAFLRAPQVEAVYRDTPEALIALTWVEQLMWERLDEIREARYHFRALPKYREVILVIDEGGELSPADAIDTQERKEKSMRAQCMNLLSTIIRVGREPGIHVVYATQRPDRNTLPLTIRSQMEARFCFRVKEDYDSEIVLRHKGAEKLNGVGRMLFQLPSSEQEVQAVLVPDEVVDAWLKSFGDVPIDVEWTEDKEDEPSGYASSLSNVIAVDFVRRD